MNLEGVSWELRYGQYGDRPRSALLRLGRVTTHNGEQRQLVLVPAEANDPGSFETRSTDLDGSLRAGSVWSSFLLLPAGARPAKESGTDWVRTWAETGQGAQARCLPAKQDVERQLSVPATWPAGLAAPQPAPPPETGPPAPQPPVQDAAGMDANALLTQIQGQLQGVFAQQQASLMAALERSEAAAAQERAALTARLAALEAPRPPAAQLNPDQGTGVFDDLGHQAMPEPATGSARADALLRARIEQAQPRPERGVRFAPAPRTATSEPQPRAETPEPPRGPGAAYPERHRMDEGSDDPTTRELLEVLSSGLQALAQRQQSAPAKRQVKGAQAQIDHDDYREQLETREGQQQVIEEFDAAVKRLSSEVRVPGNASGPLEMRQVVETWRDNAPLQDRRSLARVSEAVLHALGALRAGQPLLAEAQLCLLLAGIDQAARDDGKWGRGQLLTCCQDPPFIRYRKVEAVRADEQLVEQDKKNKLGQKGVFCSLARATNARSVVLEQAGATSQK